MDNLKDKFYLIKLFKKLDPCYRYFKNGETNYTINYLNSLGYICDLELSCNLITVYKNDAKQKLIIGLNGIAKECVDYVEELKIFHFLNYINNYIIKTCKLVELVNKKYNQYEKMYLGYSMGGTMINNYVYGEKIIAYTYNPVFCSSINKHNIKIINYCEQYDMQNLLFRTNIGNQKYEIVNSHNDTIFSDIQNINLININDIKKKMKKYHFIYTIKYDKNIEIYF